VLCIVPRLLSSAMRPLPVRFSPVIEKKHFTVDITLAVSEAKKTLFPFDFIGLYNRRKFVEIGGFDHTITAAYWQNLDFSLRSWLWGETIVLSPRVQIAYDTDPIESDTSPNASYLRCYLKNIAPVVKSDYGYIPGSTFFSYKKRSRTGFFDAKRQFDAGRSWVEANKFRFTRDITSLCAEWEHDAE
jgi:GT2 family glycosyltransferase